MPDTQKSHSSCSSESEEETTTNSRTQSHSHEGPRPASSPNLTRDNTEILMRIFLNAAQRLWLQIKQISSYLMVELGGYQFFDKVAQWCIRNPHIAICLVAGGVVMMLPILVILGFGISTIIMTLTGFLVLEGTLLSIVSVLMFGFLGAIAIVLVFFTVVGVAVYFGFAHVYDLYGAAGGEHRSALKQFLQKERTSARPRAQRRFSAGDAGTPLNGRRNESIENISQ